MRRISVSEKKSTSQFPLCQPSLFCDVGGKMRFLACESEARKDPQIVKKKFTASGGLRPPHPPSLATFQLSVLTCSGALTHAESQHSQDMLKKMGLWKTIDLSVIKEGFFFTRNAAACRCLLPGLLLTGMKSESM